MVWTRAGAAAAAGVVIGVTACAPPAPQPPISRPASASAATPAACHPVPVRGLRVYPAGGHGGVHGGAVRPC